MGQGRANLNGLQHRSFFTSSPTVSGIRFGASHRVLLIGRKRLREGAQPPQEEESASLWFRIPHESVPAMRIFFSWREVAASLVSSQLGSRRTRRSVSNTLVKAEGQACRSARVSVPGHSLTIWATRGRQLKAGPY